MQTVLGNPFNPQRGGDLQVENQCYRGSGQLQATNERLVTHSLVLIWLWLSASYRAISTELFITGSHKFVVSHISSEMFPKKEWQFEMVIFFFFILGLLMRQSFIQLFHLFSLLQILNDHWMAHDELFDITPRVTRGVALRLLWIGLPLHFMSSRLLFLLSLHVP